MQLAPVDRFFFGWLFVPVIAVLGFAVGALSVIGNEKFGSMGGALFIGSVLGIAVLIVATVSTLVVNTVVYLLRGKLAESDRPRVPLFWLCATPFLLIGAVWLLSFALTSLGSFPWLPLVLCTGFAALCGWWQSRDGVRAHGLRTG